MKRIADETGARSTNPPTVHPPTISAAPSHAGIMPSPRRFTADELRNLSRPPGDYSWLENELDPYQRDFLFHGVLPKKSDDLRGLFAFCMDNKLAGALSYLCVKANLKELGIGGQAPGYDRVDFICNWAQTIDFEIGLDFCYFSPDQTPLPLLQMVENSPAVKQIEINLVETSQEFQRALLHAFKNKTPLEKLVLANMRADVVDDLTELIRLTLNIKDLYFSFDEDMEEEAVIQICDSIGQNTSIVSLGMRMEVFSEYLEIFLPMLEKKSGLESLMMDLLTLHEDDAHALAKVLEKNASLRRLEISTEEGNGTSVAAAEILLSAIKTNNKLASLGLQMHKLSGFDKDERDLARALGELIRMNTTLQSFSLDCWELTNTSAAEIANALPFNTCIRTLNLDGGFEQSAILTIIKNLSSPWSKSALSTLSLCSYHQTVFSSPIDDIALLIRSNRKLESIKLEFSYSKPARLLSLEEMGALSAAVQSNHTLINFDLCTFIVKDIAEFIWDGRDQLRTQHEFIKADESTLIEQGTRWGPHYEEFVSKIRANAEARKLRLGTVLALGVLAPEIPAELFEIIADKLTFRNEEAPQESGTAAMRHLAKMVGAD